ncbi:hypothetical protein ACJX0J_016859, partial [Zea mays]
LAACCPGGAAAASAGGERSYDGEVGRRRRRRRAAAGVPLPPDGRGADHLLPPLQGRGRRLLRRPRHRGDRPEQVRAMGAPGQGEDGGEGVVLLLPPRPQVPDGPAHQPRHGGRLLEGHRQGPRGPQRPQRRAGGHEEDARLLPGPRPQGPEDALGHARVPPRRHLRLPFPSRLYE